MKWYYKRAPGSSSLRETERTLLRQRNHKLPKNVTSAASYTTQGACHAHSEQLTSLVLVQTAPMVIDV